MSYNNVPERPIDPPEDKRKAVYSCEICDDPILEGEDYFNLPWGICCEECIKEAKCLCAEL